VNTLGKIVAVEEVIAPVFLWIVDIGAVFEHLLSVIDCWRRRDVAELAPVTAASGDVDDVVTEALLMQF
jgi:hypothetical protein